MGDDKICRNDTGDEECGINLSEECVGKDFNGVFFGGDKESL